LLQFAAGGFVTTAVAGIMGTAGAQDLPRPPGALEENAFIARCSRCLRCLSVCHPIAIQPGHWLDGPRNLGTPILLTAKCIRCMECIRTCPTGALSKIPKAEVRLGRMVLDREVCPTWLNTSRCDRCFRACRRKAISLVDRRYPVIDMDRCEACGICIRRCPEPGALYLDPAGARRYQPQPGRFIVALEDRVGPYEVPPPSYAEWFTRRIRILARNYGLIE
jgi:ferredoxin